MKKSHKEKEVKFTIIKLEEDQHIFSLKKEDNTQIAWIVSTKEKQIMEKQQNLKKTIDEMVNLATTIELKEVTANAIVQRGEETVYSNVPEKK